MISLTISVRGETLVKKGRFDTDIIFQKKKIKIWRTSLYPNIGSDTDISKKKKKKIFKKLCMTKNRVFGLGLRL